MKQPILLTFIIFIGIFVKAQNVGIGTDNPAMKLDIVGGFRATAEYAIAVNPPAIAQTYTMVNGSTLTMPSADSIGRVYDPGGPQGSYKPNFQATFVVNSGSSFLSFVIESVDLGAGDSLIIYDNSASSGDIVAAYGNNFAGNNIAVSLPHSYATILFKSNADASTGTGFSILIKRNYLNTNIVYPPVTTGASVFFHPGKAAFRAGLFTGGTELGNQSFAGGNGTIASGIESTAFGYLAVASGNRSFAIGGSGFTGTSFINTKAAGNSSVAIGAGAVASGPYAVAMGQSTIASGDGSVALGTLGVNGANYYQTTASGAGSVAIGYGARALDRYSVALGYVTEASGLSSTAMGYFTRAQASYSTAIGASTTASGTYSTAMGRYVSTAGYSGSFIIGDNQSSLLSSTAANQMTMRFAGGYRLLTNAAGTAGLSLAAGGNSWAIISDYRKKENYLPADGKSFLQKISNMQLGSWNYIGQDKQTYRHYGPMAQEFYKHFGNDGIGTIGNDTTITSADIDGVMMVAIQALVKENEELKKQGRELKQQNEQLEKQNTAIEARLQKLEALMKEQEK